MWTDLPCPTIIAHRGDKAHAPENTLAAFKLAADKRADAIELDVKLTADGQVVVLHDQMVNRTTNGSGSVSRYPLAALCELDAGAWFAGEFRGERIPSLDEVFETVGKRIHMNVELTNYATPHDGLVAKVVEVVRRHCLQNQVLFSSFSRRNLHEARRFLPGVRRSLLTMPGLAGFWGRTFTIRTDYFGLHPYISDVTAGLVTRIHADGKRIQVWTVKSENDMKRMIGLGVDGIFTDDPALALRVSGRSQ